MSDNKNTHTASSLLIFAPTFNERDNVSELIRRIKSLGVSGDILFIDDNSPDGTGDLLDAFAREDEDIAVIHRKSRSGIGSAHREALRYAGEKGYKRLITMDADLTHAPEDIPRFLEQPDAAGMVAGSRYLPGSIDKRAIREKLISRLSHLATSIMLGLPYDVSNAFRLYRLDRIDPDLFPKIQSEGYAFFFESLYILKKNGIRVIEIPIRLSRRISGNSKMRFRDTLRWGKRLMTLRWTRRYCKDCRST